MRKNVTDSMGEEPGIKLPTSVGTQKRIENSRKTSTSASLTMLKRLTVQITENQKFLKGRKYKSTLTTSCEACIQVKKQQLGPDTEVQTGSKLVKEHIKTVYCHHAYLTYMQSISCEMLGWLKHKMDSRWLGAISIPSERQMTPYGRK